MERVFSRHVAAVEVERGGDAPPERDEVAVEEPLEIRADGVAIAVTMRTPGEDEALAAGFLAGEGLILGPEDVLGAGPSDDLAANVVDVRTRDGLRRDPSAERSFHLTSSCGVCGKAALESVRIETPDAGPPQAVDPELVRRAPEELRGRQRSFDRTGGLHAAALFDRSGEVLAVHEDVGRHNAMDKALGEMLLAAATRCRGCSPA